MKNIKGSLLERVQRDDLGKQDFRVRGKDLMITERGTIVRKVSAGKEGIQFSEFAFTQLMNRYGLPVRETKQMLNSDPHKVYRIINNIMSEDDTEMLVRARSIGGRGVVRAILSKDYVILNNSQIIETLTENLEESKMDYNIESNYIDDGRMHVRVTFNPISDAFGKDVYGNDDIIKSGVDIINSETGRSSFRMEPMIYRLVCSNGLKAWVGDEEKRVSQRHIFITNKELNDLVHTGVESSIETAQGVLTRFENTKKIEIYNPVKEIIRLSEDQGLSKKLTDTVVKSFEIEPMKNRYGVINAFTRGARGLSNTQRLQLETFAGRLMTDESLFQKVA